MARLRLREGAGQPDMRQRDTGARETGAALPDRLLPPTGGAGGLGGSSPLGNTELPPGQYVPRRLPVLHYGRVPTFNPATWDLRVCRATRSGAEQVWTWAEFSGLPRCEV